MLFISIAFRLTSQSEYIYNSILSTYVSENGNVNYKGLLKEDARFDHYLDKMSESPPAENDLSDYAKAYWINAYNAFTIRLIIDNYPLESITDLHPFFYIPFFNTVWHDEFFQIGEEYFSLDKIEHDILREKFNDPRIHFAINCASKSCPNLLNEEYTSDKLDEQLNTQVKKFLNDKTKNKIGSNKLELSEIFDWFEDDFDAYGGVIPFIDRYTDINIEENAEISFLPYDWSLNEF